MPVASSSPPEFKLAGLSQQCIRQTIEDLQTRSSSALLLAVQCKDLDEYFNCTRQSIESRAAEVHALEKSLNAVQASVEERFAELQDKMKQVESLSEAVEVKFREVEVRERQFDLKQEMVLADIKRDNDRVLESTRELAALKEKIDEKLLVIGERESVSEIELQKRTREFEIKEKGLEECLKEFDLGEKSFNEQVREFRLKEKKLEKDIGLLESDKKEFRERCRELEAKEKGLKRRLGEILPHYDTFRERSADLEQRENKIQKRVKELELQETRHEEKLREFKIREAKYHERNTALEQQKKKIEMRLKELESQESRFAERLGVAMLEEEKLQERNTDVDHKEKQIEKRCIELASKERQLEEQSKLLEQKTKEFEEQYRKLKAKEKQFSLETASRKSKLGSITHCDLAMQSAESDKTYGISVQGSMDADLHFSVTVDGKALQEFLNQHWTESDPLEDEVFKVLRLSSNPGKLVLDAMQGFYPLHLHKEGIQFEQDIVRRSCIQLLEQLMKLSPLITPEVKNEAMKLAFVWITKMKTVENQVLGFLLLLAAYGLAHAFDSNELLSYLEIVAQHSQAPKILHVVGLADKIDGTNFDLNLAPNLHRAFGLSKLISRRAGEVCDISSQAKENMPMSLAGGEGGEAAKSKESGTSNGLCRKRRLILAEDAEETDIEENNDNYITNQLRGRRRQNEDISHNPDMANGGDFVSPPVMQERSRSPSTHNHQVAAVGNGNKQKATVPNKCRTWERESMFEEEKKNPKNIVEFEDPEFSDFDKCKTEESFVPNQIWAIYDSVDVMPRYYARIEKVFSPGFKLQITWLETDPDGKAEQCWCNKSLPVACGKYITGATEETKDLRMFSHEMNIKQIGKISYFIYPKRGETWAVFKYWNRKWALEPENHKPPYQMEYVEIQSDFAWNRGIAVDYLCKLEGFVSLFRQTQRVVIICREDFYKFSHRVPSFVMSGKEKEGVPIGCLELDPAALV